MTDEAVKIAVEADLKVSDASKKELERDIADAVGKGASQASGDPAGAGGPSRQAALAAGRAAAARSAGMSGRFPGRPPPSTGPSQADWAARAEKARTNIHEEAAKAREKAQARAADAADARRDEAKSNDDGAPSGGPKRRKSRADPEREADRKRRRDRRDGLAENREARSAEKHDWLRERQDWARADRAARAARRAHAAGAAGAGAVGGPGAPPGGAGGTGGAAGAGAGGGRGGFGGGLGGPGSPHGPGGARGGAGAGGGPGGGGGGLGGPGYTNEQRLRALFPGAERINMMLGGGARSLPWVRRGMAGATFAGAVASGNPLIGAAGGGLSGLQSAADLGRGRFGGPVAVAASVLAAGGAAVVGGVQRAYGNVPRAMGLTHALMPSYTFDPSMGAQYMPGMRQVYRDLSLRQPTLAPDEAAGVMGGMTSGGWAGTPRHLAVTREAMRSYANRFGTDVSSMDAIERLRAGGNLGGADAAGSNLEAMERRAMLFGFKGPQVGDFMNTVGALSSAAEARGTQFNWQSFAGMAGQLGATVGAPRGLAMAGGLQSALTDIATQGLAGAPHPTLGMMLGRAFGELDLSQGQSLESLWKMQEKIESGENNATGLRSLREQFSAAAGGDEYGKLFAAQESFRRLGINVGAKDVKAFMNDNVLPDVLTPGVVSDNTRAAAAFDSSYAAARTPQEVRTEVHTAQTDIAAADQVTGISLNAERARANMAEMATNATKLGEDAMAVSRAMGEILSAVEAISRQMARITDSTLQSTPDGFMPR